jgi:low temperature requirement protein LtrA
MELVVGMYLAAQVLFTVLFIVLMRGAARKRRLGFAIVFGAMALSIPVLYPLSAMLAGELSAPAGLAIMAAMVGFVGWLAP